MSIAQIVVHNNLNGIHTYADVDELILSTCEWYDENEGECDMHVSDDNQLIMLTFNHFSFGDGDTVGVIVKAELPDFVDPVDLVARLKACC